MLHLGSVGNAHQWVANWTTAYLEHKAAIPESPVTDTYSYFR